MRAIACAAGLALFGSACAASSRLESVWSSKIGWSPVISQSLGAREVATGVFWEARALGGLSVAAGNGFAGVALGFRFEAFPEVSAFLGLSGIWHEAGAPAVGVMFGVGVPARF